MITLQQIKTWRAKHSTFLLMLALITSGALLRLPGQGRGFWREELHVYYAAHLPNLAVLFERLPALEHSPPLFYTLMWFWVRLSAGSDALFPVPSFICGLCLIPAMYFLGTQAHSKLAGKIGAAIAAFAPMAVYWSQEVRLYEFAALASCLSFGTYLQALRTKQKRHFVLFFLAIVAQAYLHYTCLIPLGMLFLITIFGYFKQRGKEWQSLLLCFVGLGLAFAPWLPLMLGQAGAGIPDNVTPVLSEWPVIFCTNLIFTLPLPMPACAAIVGVIAHYIFVACILPALLFLGWLRSLRFRKDNVVTLSILATCYLVEAGIVQYVTPPYRTTSYLYIVIPLAWCLVASIAAEFWPKLQELARIKLRNAIYAVLALACCALLALDAASDCNDMKGWRSGIIPIVKGLAEAPKEQQKQMAFLVVPDFNSVVFAYYVHVTNLSSPVHGLAVWDDSSPFCLPQTSAAWLSPNLVNDTLKRIEALASKEHITRLFVSCDQHMPDDPKYPAKQAAANLFVALNKRYRLLAVRTYSGLRDVQDVYIFELDP